MQVNRNLRLPDALLTKTEKTATRVGLTVQDYVVGLINGTVRQRFTPLPAQPFTKGVKRMVNFSIDEGVYERFLDRCPVQSCRPLAGAGLARILREAV